MAFHTSLLCRDSDFLSVELVEGTSVITGPKCNKGLISNDWDNETCPQEPKHGYLNLQSWHHGSCDQTEPEKKKKIRKNTIESSNGSRLKFIAPDQINMSSPFAYIKCQAKQFYTQWTDMFFVFCFFFCLLATIICYMYYFTA